MKNIILILALVAVCMISCSRSAQQQRVLSEAERIVSVYPDSALYILEDIDPKELKEDSLRALYAIVIGGAHKTRDNSMVADTLTRYAFDYYRGRNLRRFLQAGELYAIHRFWLGDGDGSLNLLDSLIGLPDIPKDLKIKLLRTRIGIGNQQVDSEKNISAIRQIMIIDTIAESQYGYKHQLFLNQIYIGQNDSALILLNELIDDARNRGLADKEFEYKYVKIAVLEEGGMYAESNRLVDYIIENAPDNSEMSLLHFWKALNYLNLKDYKTASEELALGDNSIKNRSLETRNYYESFAGHIRAILSFQSEGKIRTVPMAKLYNTQRNRWHRDEKTRYEQRQSALKVENRALILKSQSERKTYIIVIVSLVAFILLTGGIWLLQKRKSKIMETEERAETLQRMVDELKKPSLSADNQETLRRTMLQQLNIIKMVAKTPTEQNIEMLRKISAVDNDSDGPLVNWSDVYEIIDNLYSAFYTKLHSRYGDIISEKEEQTIVMLAAGFSAKEISIITSQSAASIYVRKSSVKKKLGVSEKEDVIEYLRQELSH